MRRGEAAAVAGAFAVAAVIGLIFLGSSGTLVALAVLAALAAMTALGTRTVLLARRRAVAGRLSHQLAIAVVLVIGPLLAALAVLGVLMFVSGHDAALVALIVAFTGILGVVAARRLAAAIIGDVERLRDGLVAVGHGERKLQIQTDGGDELGDLAHEANAMISRLASEEAARDQSESARRHLIAAASHDLRTPITSLRLLAEAVDDRVVDDQLRREYVSRMRTHIDALAALIDDLFELSRLEAGEIAWSLERVPLSELVNETVAAMRVHGELKGVAVRAELPSRLDAARANPEKLQRVLFNLIQNAIRHTPPDGSVVVRAEPVADAIEIEVFDTGNGIAPEEREFVFDAFYRGAADAARSSAGAGLGLAISRAIIEAHGGRIWIPPSAAGTRVRFSLRSAA
ncbi:MAG: HAMP domain-containing sensor histidine kinase [Solirubrobacteraceae bacterium]